MQVRFIGDCSTVLGDEVEDFGRAIEMTEEQFEHHVRGGAALVTEEEWTEAGLTDKDAKDFRYLMRRVHAPADFVEKRRAAYQAFHERYIALVS